MRTISRTYVLCLVGIALAAALVSIWRLGSANATQGKSRTLLYYQDSMHPWVKSDVPGKCTICAMDLTAVYAGDKGSSEAEDLVMLGSNSVTVLNVQTEAVRREPLRLSVRVAGTLEADETRKAVFSAPAAGRIEEMAVESVGDEVEVEQRLFTFYSPELATWRRAYVIRNRSSTLTTPFFAGRPHERAETIESPKADAPTRAANSAVVKNTAETDPNFSDLLSPLSGTVVERKVYNGQYVAEGDRLLTLVDTSVMWFRFDVYEQQLAWLQKGQKVRVTVPAVPGREFSAVVSRIEPVVDETTRTAKVRADISNPLLQDSGRKTRALRLGMFATGLVMVEVTGTLTVPRGAVLFPGGQAYAYVEQAPGSYAMRAIRLGRQGEDCWQVLEGLEEGEKVVTSGNVLIDAQAQVIRPGRSSEADVPERRLAALSPGANQLGVMDSMAGEELNRNPGPGRRANALSETQRRALAEFLTVADMISTSLSSDSLEQFQRATAELPRVLEPALKTLDSAPAVQSAVREIKETCGWSEATDLASARQAFRPFSTRVVELAERLRAEPDGFRHLKVYHCSMAPKPGLWFQAGGPLRNPFYGAKMLSCGEEVRPPASSRVADLTEAVPHQAPEGVGEAEEAPALAEHTATSQPALPRRPAAGLPVGTANTRHPEAKERMMRSFSIGLLERHRATLSPATDKEATSAAPLGDSKE